MRERDCYYNDYSTLTVESFLKKAVEWENKNTSELKTAITL